MSISLTGLASGLDTAAIIESLMKIERIPYENLQTRKQELANEQSIIRSINTKLVTLRNAAADLMYSSSFSLTSAKTSDGSIISVSSGDNAATGSYQIEVTQLAQKHVVGSGEFVKDGAPLTGTITFQGNGNSKTITLSGSTIEEMLNNLRDEINSAKVGVQASVIETSPGKLTLVLTSDKYGTEADMRFGTMPATPDQHTYIDGDAALLQALGLQKADGTINTKQKGQNAMLTVNNIAIEHGGNTLDNVLPGLTLNLLQKGSSTVTVETDVDKIAAKIQAFVDAYNDVVNTIRTNTAKGAVLQGDSTLRTLQSQLSELFNGKIGPADYNDEKLKFLFEIGLEIDKGVTSGSNMTGKITFDKEKFKKVFAEKPEEVMYLFTHDEENESNLDGVAVRFYNELYNWTRTGNGYLASKITGYDASIEEITDQMERLDLRLQNRQRQLETQFAAMETALAQLRNQQNWLASQISSLSLSV